MARFEILGFARKNSPVSAYLDVILSKLENATLHDCPQKDMPYCKYAYLYAQGVGYTGVSTVARIAGNEHALRTGYITRKNDAAQEIPYLDRWLDATMVEGAPGVCIAVVLYSREQLAVEGIQIEADYGIVTAQAEPFMGISPMPPATILRNSMGKDFGGNGAPIDREYYKLAVEYWSQWAIVR